MTDQQPRVGVVIPCKNEAATIERCLLALRAQSVPVDRIVVVDNGSTDGSDAVAARYAEVLHFDGRGISKVRNAGARHLADCDVLGFVDADCEVGPRWLESGLDALAEADLVGARTRAPHDAPWVAGRWAVIEDAQQHDDSLLWSQHLLARRSTFDALGGFDEALGTNEDADLSQRVIASGGRIAHVPGMDVIHHGFAPDLRSFVRRERWHTSTPGWFDRMSPKSKAVVVGCGAWTACAPVAAAALVTGRRAPAAVWALGTVVGIPALGYVATRTPEHAVEDGILMWTWALTRAASLGSELPTHRGTAA